MTVKLCPNPGSLHISYVIICYFPPVSSGKSRHLLDKSCEGSPGPCCHEESGSQEGGINHLFEERPKISVSGEGHPA